MATERIQKYKLSTGTKPLNPEKKINEGMVKKL
jgi:hypothetical protein